MKVAVFLMAFAVLLGGVPQGEKKQDEEQKQEEERQEPFDPFADPREELLRRAERTAQDKRLSELKEASADLVALSATMREEIDKLQRDVVSVKLLEDLDRAEKLIKTMRDRAK